eukprot:1161282-Pelagomonas_calceolata.AAC.14
MRMTIHGSTIEGNVAQPHTHTHTHTHTQIHALAVPDVAAGVEVGAVAQALISPRVDDAAEVQLLAGLRTLMPACMR